MSRSHRHFESFQPHTLVKHRILRAYLATWAMKLLQWGHGGRTVYFVDAFAGAGRDKQGRPGSPLIGARIAAQTQAYLRAHGTPNAAMRLIAIEKQPSRAKKLCDYLAPFLEVDPDLVTVLEGELVDHIDSIRAKTRGAPTLYFLDPFGIKGLDSSTYAKALEGPQNEMFVLFADIGATRLHGLVSASGSKVEEQVRRLHAQVPLFEEMEHANNVREIELREAAQIREDAIDLSRPASAAHLTRALGDNGWREQLDFAGAAAKSDVFLGLFITRLVQAGAQHALTVPMRNEAGRRVYSLVHASKSVKGFTAMKESVSTGLRAGDLPQDVCELIRADLKMPLRLVAEWIEEEFRGREVRWTGPKGDDANTVKRAVLERTSIFGFQIDELLNELVRRGYVETGTTGKPRKPVFVRVPPVREA